jgi:glycosyltransferase involved in cell wall biosynthesis
MHRELAAYGPAFQQFLRGARSIMVHADWITSLLRVNGAEEDQIRRINLGVDAAFHETLKTAEPPRTGREFVVAYVGRLEPPKGPQLLVEAFRGLINASARLWLVGGDNSQSGKWERQLRALAGGDSRIEFRGLVPYAEMPKVYQAVSLLAVPSVSYETGPFVVREALARTIPVAASGTIGDPELVRRAGGWIVAGNSVREWRELFASCLAKFQAGEWSPGRPVEVPTSAEMYEAIVESYAAAVRN